MLNRLNFIHIFLNNSKNFCLSFMKFLKRRKVKTTLRVNNVNTTEKIDPSEGGSSRTSNGDNGPKIDLNWCLGQLSNGLKIIFVLYANDCQQCLHQLTSKTVTVATKTTAASVPCTTAATADAAAHHQSSAPIFQLKLINVQDEEEQLSVVRQVQLESMQLLPLQQLSALVCILISSKMTYLINTITNNTESARHPMRHWLAPTVGSFNSSSEAGNEPQTSFAATDTDGDGGPAVMGTFACYDELNEINMFQVKYKLAPCTTYIATDSANLHEDIQKAARRLCNEALYRSHLQHQQQQQYLNLAVRQSKKPMFKVFPKQIHETNGKVLLSLDEAITSDQLLDVLLNGRCAFDHFSVKWRNSSTLSFTVPDHFLIDCKQVDISVVINCTTFLGTRTIKCNRKAAIDCGNFISSVNSAHSLCQSLGTHGSMEKLDAILAQVFTESPLDSRIFASDSTDKTNQLLPSWLIEMVMQLIKYPASTRSSIVHRYASDARPPIDLATEHGRLEVFRILNSYSRTIEKGISQEQLIVLPNASVVPGSTSTVNCPLLHLFSTPTLSTGQSRQVNRGAEMLSSDPVSTLKQVNADTSDTALATCSLDCTTSERSTKRILEAKNELILLIEEFKRGISIECFEQMFSNWEHRYSDVLEGQMSEELLYSLNQIKMLCTLDTISDLDYDDGEEEEEDENEKEEVEKKEQCNGGSVNVTGADGDYVETAKKNKTQQCYSALNESKNTRPTTITEQIDNDPNGKQLKQGTRKPSHGLIEQCTASYNKNNDDDKADGSTTTTRQVSLTYYDGHLNLFAIDANRQFSRDLNSINMSDNEVCPEEPRRQRQPLQERNCRWRTRETHQQVTTVSDCQAECHQFGGLFGPSSTNTYITPPNTSAHWGQVMLQQPTKESISPPESEWRHSANPTRLLAETQWPSVDNNTGDNTCSSRSSTVHSNELPLTSERARMATQQAHHRLRQTLPQANISELVYQPSPLPPSTNLIAVRQLTKLPVSYCSDDEKNEKKLSQLPTPQTAKLDRTSPSADDRMCRLRRRVDSHGEHDYYHFGSSCGGSRGGQVATNFIAPAKQQASASATKVASADCSLTGKASIAAAKKTNQSLPLVGLVDRRANRSMGALSSGLAGASQGCTSTNGSHYYLIPRSIPVPVSSSLAATTTLQ